MRIQIASDLHHESPSSDSSLARALTPAPGADALVLAGDIHVGTAAMNLYQNYAILVIYVHGNQEPMQNCYPALIDEFEQRSSGTSVRFLQNDEVVLSGTRFLGACLWSDYLLFPLRFSDSLEHARHAITDYKLVRKADGKSFRPEDAIGHQRETLLWLRERLDAPFAGKTVVVIHHLPSGRSVEPRHREHKLAPACASDLELLVERADLWIHGHAHWSADYQIGKCRVVCNPRGRPGRNGTNLATRYENAHFNPTLTVDI
ncbi:calcineurin-like phosphoesterase family protein [Paraburkholderia sp. BL6665CI2N2]|uniref:metallophosphoesterase n=1 Tax=Paraburkholderia sp. BL6665CI2N2 TaxID=1938806 RepID=UPI0010653919|nr:metallophosphoesterase [Paraburkholderia sp. BL6665CI2N2]TDY21938.1 calcineurin-like phosphoesterase family protein [Paraburkholderia sp. BL6665CI2N2]